jgi:hypothetical protein
MNKMLCVIFLMIIPSILNAQSSCINASGKTAAFFLSAGSKASWNNTKIAYEKQPAVETFRSLVCKQTKGSIVFDVRETQPLDQIAIFSSNGSKVATLRISGDRFVALTQRLGSGVYFACLESGTTKTRSIRFWVWR